MRMYFTQEMLKGECVESETVAIASLYKKLYKAQSEFKEIKKDKDALGYKYAQIDTVLDAISSLKSNNLVLKQPLLNDVIYTTITDIESGITIELCFICINDDMLKSLNTRIAYVQNIGLLITYLRRYSILNAFCLAAEDNDANIKNVDNNTIIKNNTAIKTNIPKIFHNDFMQLAKMNYDNLTSIDQLNIEKFYDKAVFDALSNDQKIGAMNKLKGSAKAKELRDAMNNSVVTDTNNNNKGETNAS